MATQEKAEAAAKKLEDWKARPDVIDVHVGWTSLCTETPPHLEHDDYEKFVLVFFVGEVPDDLPLLVDDVEVVGIPGEFFDDDDESESERLPLRCVITEQWDPPFCRHPKNYFDGCMEEGHCRLGYW